MALPQVSELHNALLSGQTEIVVFSFLAAVGLFYFLSSITIFLRSIWITFLRPSKSLRSYGSWAIVTGATDGIGKGFVNQLAKKKINVILLSRSQDKLQTLASEVEGKFGVQTRIVAVDLTGPDLVASLAPVARLVAELDVGILVNNAGMSYPYAQFLHEVSPELITDLIRINVEAVTRLTAIVLPGMLKRQRGAVVNIGSGAATVLPSDPLYAVYAATKGYVDQFSKTLAVEYKAKGIDVQCQAPLYVATKLAKIRNASLTCPSANTFAKYGVSRIGYEVVCTPFWAHSLMWWVISLVPERLMNTVRLSQNLSIRKRALAKEARKKSQ